MTATGGAGSLGPADLRAVVREHAGFDPGVLTPTTRLDDVGLSGLARLSLVVALEARYQVELPVDLVAAIETVDDLIWFTSVKVDQQRPGPGADGRWP